MSNTNAKSQTKQKPSHVVKTKTGYGENVCFIRLGAAYERPEGKGLYVRLTGKQVIDNGFYLFPIEDKPAQTGAAQ